MKETLRKWMPLPVLGSPHDVADQPPAATQHQGGQDESQAGPIDPDVLRNLFGDDQDTIRRILGDFVTSAWETVAEIEKACKRKSAKHVSDLSHRLRSSSAMIGARSISDLCSLLEHAGEVPDWPTIERQVPKLRDRMSEVVEFVAV